MIEQSDLGLQLVLGTESDFGSQLVFDPESDLGPLLVLGLEVIQSRTTVASETLEGMFLVNNSLNTQCRALKPLAMDPGME